MDTPVCEFGLLALLNKVGLRGIANQSMANGYTQEAASWSSDSLSSSLSELFTAYPLGSATSSTTSLDISTDGCTDSNLEEIDEHHFARSMLTVALIEEHDDEYYDHAFSEQPVTDDTGISHTNGRPSPLGYGGIATGMEHEGDDCDEAFSGAQFAMAMLTVALNEQHDDQYYNLKFGIQASTCDTATPSSASSQASPLGYSGNYTDDEDESDGNEKAYGAWYAHSMMMVTSIEEHDDIYYNHMFGDHASPVGYSGDDTDIGNEGED